MPTKDDHDDAVAQTISNRDDPVPVFEPPLSDEESNPNQSSKGKRRRVKDAVKRKAQGAVAATSNEEEEASLGDRLITKILDKVLPSHEMDEMKAPEDEKSSEYVTRPGLSFRPSNFRRFNARVGIVFVFQKRVEQLLTWQRNSHTLSLLTVLTFICLDPYLLSAVPVVGILFFILIPAYLVRHPPPPQTDGASYKLGGPPLAPAHTIKPAGETSKDFFRNMRDIHNSMDDFSNIHDAVLAYATPLTNFSNEALSSTIFMFLFTTAILLFLFAHIIPWRFVSLVFCHSVVIVGHPKVRQAIRANRHKVIDPQAEHAQSWFDSWISRDVILDSPPETRQVEVFELQHRSRSSRSDEWEAWLFTPTPFDPLSPHRISGDRPKGTRFFEDVGPPTGWAWSDKKWVLDLNSQEWVEDRMVQGVEVEIDGERWVSDLLSNDDQEQKHCTGETSAAEQHKVAAKTGYWRRRRWIRTVQRETFSTP